MCVMNRNGNWLGKKAGQLGIRNGAAGAIRVRYEGGNSAEQEEES